MGLLGACKICFGGLSFTSDNISDDRKLWRHLRQARRDRKLQKPHGGNNDYAHACSIAISSPPPPLPTHNIAL
ncbi:unnamed protein product [Lactuca virosa]|uniref:Uncharacterized protein n=1 Tax=Lactuca virosa TaxID=75947 RepID=A0AAU9NGI3_9ASTR|nr:unnamed protein product [Lactuca virosa]